jgi:hypothetical protein
MHESHRSKSGWRAAMRGTSPWFAPEDSPALGFPVWPAFLSHLLSASARRSGAVAVSTIGGFCQHTVVVVHRGQAVERKQGGRALFAELSGLFDAGELHIRKAPGCSGAPSSLL